MQAIEDKDSVKIAYCPMIETEWRAFLEAKRKVCPNDSLKGKEEEPFAVYGNEIGYSLGKA